MVYYVSSNTVVQKNESHQTCLFTARSGLSNSVRQNQPTHKPWASNMICVCSWPSAELKRMFDTLIA